MDNICGLNPEYIDLFRATPVGVILQLPLLMRDMLL